MALPAGWYPVAGDPAGTKRYWDGSDFTTSATRDPNVVVRKSTGSAAQKWQLASPYARLVAWIVDYLAPFVVFVGLGTATGYGTVPDSFSASQLTEYYNLALVYGGFWLINHAVFLGYWGTTLGKTLVGLRVVRATDSSQYPGIARALVRSLVTVPTFLLSGVMLFMGKRRTFNDVVAGTAVVYT